MCGEDVYIVVCAGQKEDDGVSEREGGRERYDKLTPYDMRERSGRVLHYTSPGISAWGSVCVCVWWKYSHRLAIDRVCGSK